MRRNVSGWVAGVALAAVVAACGDNSGGYEGDWGDGIVAGGQTGCSQYGSCGTCTPVIGCGWCFNVSGGQCAPSPDQCAFSSDAEFTWTWNPSGCPDVDASVVLEPPATRDGGAEASVEPEASADGSEASVSSGDASGLSADAAGAEAAAGDAHGD